MLDGDTWPFNADQYLLMNVAVLPDISASFTSSALEVDYVRVYQENPCSIPASPSTTVSSATTATLSWDAVPGAIGYQVRGGRVGGPVKQLRTTATSRTLSIFDPSTDYEWQVRAYCDPVFSSFSEMQNFTTPAVRTGPAMSVGPNPSGGTINIQFSNAEEHLLELVDLNGRILHSTQVSNQNNLVLDQLPSGLYFIRLTGAESTIQELLVVN